MTSTTTGKKIKMLRENRGLTAFELAQSIGKEGKNVSQYIYDIESDKVKRIKLNDLVKIAKALNVDIGEIVDIDEKTEGEISYLKEMKEEYRSGKLNNIEEKYIQALEEITRLQRVILDLQTKCK